MCHDKVHIVEDEDINGGVATCICLCRDCNDDDGSVCTCPGCTAQYEDAGWVCQHGDPRDGPVAEGPTTTTGPTLSGTTLTIAETGPAFLVVDGRVIPAASVNRLGKSIHTGLTHWSVHTEEE